MKLKYMTYEEFLEYCNRRACDGLWSFDECLACTEVIEKINRIRIKKFGFEMKKKTEKSREKAWKEFLDEIYKK